MTLSIDIPGFTQTGSRPHEWTAIYPAHAKNIWQRMHSDHSIMRGLRRKWSLVTSGGFKVEGMTLSPEGVRKVEEFLWIGLVYLTAFNLVPVNGRILDEGDLVPTEPDFSSGGFLWALSKRTKQVLTAWGVAEGEGSISKRPDPQTRVFVGSRPSYSTPMGYDSIVARLLPELSFRQEIVENYLAADFQRSHPVDYVHHEEERRSGNYGERGSASTKSTVHRNLFQEVAVAEEESITLSQMRRAQWAKQSLAMEESVRFEEFQNNTASQLTRRTAFDPSGRMILIDREKSSMNRMPIPPGWKVTPSSKLTAGERIIELKEAYDNTVMLALGLPPEGFMSRRKRDPAEGFSASSSKMQEQMWTKEAVQVMAMVRETRRTLAQLFDFFVTEFWDESFELGKVAKGSTAPANRYDHVMSDNSAAVEAVRMAVSRMINELKTDQGKIISHQDDAAARPEDLEKAKKGETADTSDPSKQATDKEARITDLASYLQHLLDNDLLQTEGIFQDEIQNAEQRLEDEISGEVAEIAREIYLQASTVSLNLSEENIREMILQSPQIKAKLEALEGSPQNQKEAKGKNSTANKNTNPFDEDSNRPHLVWLEPPAYSPETLNGLAASGLLNKRAYVEMILENQHLPPEMISKLMSGVQYEQITKYEVEALKPQPKAQPGSKEGSSNSSNSEKKGGSGDNDKKRKADNGGKDEKEKSDKSDKSDKKPEKPEKKAKKE